MTCVLSRSVVKHRGKPQLNVKRGALNIGNSSYISWIMDENSKLAVTNRVYTLPSIEYDFWKKMKDENTGYIKVLANAKDKQIQKDEERVVAELHDWRNLICKGALFVNLIFLVLCICLKVQSEELQKIPLTVPMRVLSWGTSDNFTNWQLDNLSCDGKFSCSDEDYADALENDPAKVWINLYMHRSNWPS